MSHPKKSGVGARANNITKCDVIGSMPKYALGSEKQARLQKSQVLLMHF